MVESLDSERKDSEMNKYRVVVLEAQLSAHAEASYYFRLSVWLYWDV